MLEKVFYLLFLRLKPPKQIARGILYSIGVLLAFNLFSSLKPPEATPCGFFFVVCTENVLLFLLSVGEVFCLVFLRLKPPEAIARGIPSCVRRSRAFYFVFNLFSSLLNPAKRFRVKKKFFHSCCLWEKAFYVVFA